MAKLWSSDFAIYAVRFNSQNTHIDYVRAYECTESGLGNSFDFSRQDAASRIDVSGTKFVTTVLGSDNKYYKGQIVETVPINGLKYLRTMNDKSERDNLDNLPRF